MMKIDMRLAALAALARIRDYNMTAVDEEGHRWAGSNLIEQEVVFAISALEGAAEKPANGVPERVWLDPTGGREGWTCLLHEAGSGDVEYVPADLAQDAVDAAAMSEAAAFSAGYEAGERDGKAALPVVQEPVGLPLWAVAAIAQKYELGTHRVGYRMRMCFAISENEAIGEAMRAFKENEPEWAFSEPAALRATPAPVEAGLRETVIRHLDWMDAYLCVEDEVRSTTPRNVCRNSQDAAESLRAALRAQSAPVGGVVKG